MSNKLPPPETVYVELIEQPDGAPLVRQTFVLHPDTVIPRVPADRESIMRVMLLAKQVFESR